MMCSNSIDRIGKFAKEKQYFYRFKDMVNIIPMVDPLISVTNCGKDSIEMDISINRKIELKKVKFHTPEVNKKSKCNVMHVGKPSKACPDMIVHGVKVDRVSQTVYLGYIISQDGTNTSNVKDRMVKGMEQVNTIMTLLKLSALVGNIFKLLWH